MNANKDSPKSTTNASQPKLLYLAEEKTTLHEVNTENKSFSVTYDDIEGSKAKSILLEQITSKKSQTTVVSSQASTTASACSTQQPTPQSQPKYFLATGIPSSKRPFVMKTIQRLGGTFLSSDVWKPECTHLLVGKPTRTEKCLAACASGAWWVFIN
jgi:hypothetical protein